MFHCEVRAGVAGVAVLVFPVPDPVPPLLVAQALSVIEQSPATTAAENAFLIVTV